MDIERMKHLKEKLMACIEGQVTCGLDKVNTCELGEVVDMVKDLSEALYYCEITKAMEEDGGEEHHTRYLPKYRYPVEIYGPRYEERYNYPMYTHEKGREIHEDTRFYGGNVDRRIQPDTDMRDMKEGKSGLSRKKYMEGKMLGKDKIKQMQELEEYMHELTTDLTEMVQDASPEEKALLQQKISTLATKIK